MRHSSQRAALRYQHAAEERDREIADRMGALVAGLVVLSRAPVASLSRDNRGTDPGNDETQAAD